MSWVVYILECGDGSLYTGITNNLEQRLDAHRNGLGAKYTRGRTPLTLVYQENCGTRSLASSREAAIKKLSKAQKVSLLR